MNMTNLFPALQISSTGLQAERTRMEVTAHNLANANTSVAKDGEVFKRKQVVFQERLLSQLGTEDRPQGVDVSSIVVSKREPLEEYAPWHPMANKRGMVKKANISPIEEMMDMITATRAYEANLSAMKQSRDMANKTITNRHTCRGAR